MSNVEAPPRIEHRSPVHYAEEWDDTADTMLPGIHDGDPIPVVSLCDFAQDGDRLTWWPSETTCEVCLEILRAGLS